MTDPTPIVAAPSKPRPRFRRTRIAVSVFFGVLTVAFCVLWVISHFVRVFVATALPTLPSGQNEFLFTMSSGLMGLHLLVVDPSTQLTVVDLSRKYLDPFSRDMLVRWFYYHDPNGEHTLVFPAWIATLICAALGTAAWVRVQAPQFSLRTMLIATTPVAVVLGLGVWLAR
jgi:hypothetical protein